MKSSLIIKFPIRWIYYDGLPWRGYREVLKWDGEYFRYYRNIFGPPEFRFQAVQDGDRATLEGRYNTALNLYSQVISSESLQGYSKDIHDTMQMSLHTQNGKPTATLPAPDPLEYDHLAAYARYRIMLLDYTRGFDAAASAAYQTLAADYPAGNPAHSYVELAGAFQGEYQASASLAKACFKALDYAHGHWKEITTYLGDTDYHGTQSLEYSKNPDFLCPFQ
ncbi:MAG: hypothetical protein AB9891_05225 [Anaerolineaceae bacterium]